MEELKDKTSNLADHVEELANTFYKLTLLNITRKTTNIAAGAVVMIATAILGLFIILFLGLAFSWWMGDILDNRIAGFLLGSGFFAFILLIIFLLRKKIVFPFIRNKIIGKIYD